MQTNLIKCLEFMLFYSIPITVRFKKIVYENVAFSIKN